MQLVLEHNMNFMFIIDQLKSEITYEGYQKYHKRGMIGKQFRKIKSIIKQKICIIRMMN